MERVNVVGSSGSGKTIFSRKLAAARGCPCVELDALFWGPNWTQRSDEEFYALIEEALLGERWCLDGNYSRSVPIKWKRVQEVVWLDFSFPRTFWRSLTRAIRRASSKEEIWPGTGNVETFRKGFFSRDSIILWSISNYSSIRRRYLATMRDPQFSHIRFTQLRSPRDAEAYLKKAPRVNLP